MNDLIFFYTIYNKVETSILDYKSLKQDAIKQYQNDVMFHRSFDMMKQLILQSEEEKQNKFNHDPLYENKIYSMKKGLLPEELKQ